MKFLKLFLSTTLCATIIFAATSCTTQTVKASEYGIVYNGYVSIATVTVRNNEITNVKIEEVATPQSWAKISVIQTEIDAEDQVSNSAYEGTATNYLYAKKIIIDDVVFVARDNTASAAFVDYFNTEKNPSISFDAWLSNSENAKWYYDAITSGDYDALKDDGTPYDVVFNESSVGALSKADRWAKSKNGYWPEGMGKGWQQNMNSITNYITENGFEHYLLEKDSLTIVDGEYEINGVKTGATVTAFTEYMNLAHSAYLKAISQTAA